MEEFFLEHMRLISVYTHTPNNKSVADIFKHKLLFIMFIHQQNRDNVSTGRENILYFCCKTKQLCKIWNYRYVL